MFIFSTTKKIKEIKERGERIKHLERELFDLKSKIEDLKCEKRELEFNNKKSNENIAHMVRIKEEKMDVEYQRKIQELEIEKIKEVSKVKDEYRDKTELQLKQAGEKLDGQYKALMEMLPNINVRLKGQV